MRTTPWLCPFHLDAGVVLPDSLYGIGTLPPADDDFSNRWKAIQIRFFCAGDSACGKTVTGFQHLLGESTQYPVHRIQVR